MNAASRDIKDRLVAQGIGVYGTTIFLGFMPDSPDKCICISDGPPLSPELNYEWERPGLQILCRNKIGLYEECEAYARSIYDILHGQNNLTINSTVYKLIKATQTPFYVGKDDSNRPVFSMNFEIQRASA